MALEDFQGATDDENVSTAYSQASTHRKEPIGSNLESIIKDALDNMEQDNSKSLFYEGNKVIVDHQELVEDIMLMCAMTVEKVNS